jgi:hypothetical protein
MIASGLRETGDRGTTGLQKAAGIQGSRTANLRNVPRRNIRTVMGRGRARLKGLMRERYLDMRILAVDHHAGTCFHE